MKDVNLTAVGWHEIRGRGWVATIADGHNLPEKVDARDLFDTYVTIDGKEYWVTGVETFQTLHYSRKHPFGLLIRGEK